MTAARLALGAILLVALAPSAGAQWLNYPTPGLPRLADGTPNLAAAPSRTADGKLDLSGIWIKDTPGVLDYFYDLAKDLPPGDVVMTPWAQAIARQRESRNHIDDPLGYCSAPPGVPRINVAPPGAFKIIQTPAVLALLYDLDTNPTFRQVHTDGRPLLKDPEPTWLGYSIGRWDGDDFVVTTAGFRDGGWLDTQRARPHSDALRVTERLRRRSIGRMDMAITIDDPKAFEKPWTVTVPFRLIPDSELLEGSCENHDKTIEHRRVDPPPPEPPSPRAAPVAAQAPAVTQPPIAGTWKLNPEKSGVQVPPDYVEIRQYRLRPDGYLVGLLFNGDSRGLRYLQFTARSDGKDYPEHSDSIVADMIAAGKPTPRTYAETKIDDYVTEWIDKVDGKITARGKKIVSKDLKTLTITVDGQPASRARVYDRQQ